MNNASVFSEEEKLPLTEVATKLAEAASTSFTVCFNTKVDEKEVERLLAQCKPEQLSNRQAALELAKVALTGKECKLVGRLSRAEGKLGRSLVIDLPTQGYRLVDHRSLRWLIIKNKKYTVQDN